MTRTKLVSHALRCLKLSESLLMFSVTGSRRHFFLQKHLSRCKYCAVRFSTPEEAVQHSATSHSDQRVAVSWPNTTVYPIKYKTQVFKIQIRGINCTLDSMHLMMHVHRKSKNLNGSGSASISIPKQVTQTATIAHLRASKSSKYFE